MRALTTALLGVAVDAAPEAEAEALQQCVRAWCAEYYDNVCPYVARLMSPEDELSAGIRQVEGEQLKQATFLPLWETPLWFLIREDIDLEKGVQVTAIERRAATIRITLQLDEAGGEGQVTLVFGDRPISLHSWEIQDAQGISTQVALVNPDFGATVERSLFEHGDLNIHFPDRRK